MYKIPILIIVVYLLAFIWFVYDTYKGEDDGRNRRR